MFRLQFFDRLAIGYGLSCSEDFWDFPEFQNLPEHGKEKLDQIFPEVKREAELVLRWLDEGKVIPTGEKDDNGFFVYLDRRSDAERKTETLETKEDLLPSLDISKRADKPNFNSPPLSRIWSWLKGKPWR